MFRMSRSVWSAPYSGAFIVSFHLRCGPGTKSSATRIRVRCSRNTAHSIRFAWFGSGPAGVRTDAPYLRCH